LVLGKKAGKGGGKVTPRRNDGKQKRLGGGPGGKKPRGLTVPKASRQKNVGGGILQTGDGPKKKLRSRRKAPHSPKKRPQQAKNRGGGLSDHRNLGCTAETSEPVLPS